MNMNASKLTGLLVSLLALVFANVCCAAGDEKPAAKPAAAPASGPTYDTEPAEQHDARTLKGLQVVIPKLDFTNLEFKDVVDFFRNASSVNFHCNWPALQAANIDPKVPVNLSLTNPTVQKALELVLQDLSTNTKVTYVIEDGVVRISTRDELARNPVQKIHPVGDILAAMAELQPLRDPDMKHCFGSNGTTRPVGTDDAAPASDPKFELVHTLMDVITRTIEPNSWAPAGTVGSISFLNDDFVVTQTLQNQQQVTDLLSSMRQSIDKKRIAFGLAVVRLDEGQNVRGLRTALAESKDIAATLQQAAGDKKASVAVDRCRIQQGFLTRPVQLVQSGAENRSYDVTVTPVERKSDGVLVQAKVSSTWVAAKVGKVDKDAPPVPIGVSDKDDYKVTIPPGGFQLIELIPTDAKGGAAVLVVWIPKRP